jgi:peptidoglycan hydrolase-like protein with peptidoglycan-binding domain
VSRVTYRPPAGATLPEGTVASFQPPTDCVVYHDRVTPGSIDSDSVYWVQRWLNSVPMPKAPLLALDGDYDQQTAAAAKVFQADVCGDPADGDLGPKQTEFLYEQARQHNAALPAASFDDKA